MPLHRLSRPRAAAGLVAALAAASLSCSETISVTQQTRTDSYQQAPTDQIDILFVIDDSASMVSEQELLADGFDDFIGGIAETNTDFHVGVIKIDFELGDPSRGVLFGDPAYVTRDDEYEKLFVERATNIGTDGSGREKGLEAAHYALSPQTTAAGGPNAGFLRSSANLLVVIVSDEDDCSDGGSFGVEFDRLDCYRRSDDLVPVPTWVERLRAIKGSRDQVRIAAIVGPEEPEGLCGEETLPGTRYIEAASLTGGASFSICEPDWSDFLEQLGVEAVSLTETFPLSCGARPGSLEVTVDDAVVAEGDYTYDAETRSVTFEGDAVPERGASVVMTYEIEPGTCVSTD